MSLPLSEQSIKNAIKHYYDDYPDTTQFVRQAFEKPLTPPDEPTALEKGVEELDVKDEQDKAVDAYVKAFRNIGGPDVIRRRKTKTQASKQKDEEKSQDAGITDKVAKESSDSTASSHELHDEDHSGISSGGNVAAQTHKWAPGPVQAENLPEPASKEELKKRAEELNK